MTTRGSLTRSMSSRVRGPAQRGSLQLMLVKKRKGRSPIKATPRRFPGQSLEEEKGRLTDDALAHVLTCLVAVGLAVYEWIKSLQESPPQPWALTVLALAICAWFGPKAVRLMRKVKSVNLGLKGEVYVGQKLEMLRERGFKVLHDIPGDGWNVDHLLIGEKGVFAIETKTYWKNSPNSDEVTYDGNEVRVAGFVPERDPVVQAKAVAGAIRGIIKERTGKDVYVRPVLLYPGWFTKTQPFGAEVWVLNENALPGFLEWEQPKMIREDVERICACLEDHVRARSGA